MTFEHRGYEFEFEPDLGWTTGMKFHEFAKFDLSARHTQPSNHADGNGRLPHPDAADEDQKLIRVTHRTASDSDIDDDQNQDEDDTNLVDELFEEGQFLVALESDEEDDPSASQIEVFNWLIDRRPALYQTVSQDLLAYYQQHRDEFRDFFNGEPAERDRLLPEVTTVAELRPLIRLTLIEIQIRARDGYSYLSLKFDTVWDDQYFFERCLWKGEIVDPDSLSSDFILPKSTGWDAISPARNGLRYVEFQYRGEWTGLYTIDPQGHCEERADCPVCDGDQIEDPTLITAVRPAPLSHLFTSLVHKLELSDWISRALTLIAPACFLLALSWQPRLFWATISISAIAGFVGFIDAGFRWTRLQTLALFEIAATVIAMRNNRTTQTKFDDIPSWTWTGLFESGIWLFAAVGTGVLVCFTAVFMRHPILRSVLPAYLIYVGGLIAGLVLCVTTDYSALHLLWFIPLNTLLFVMATFRMIQRKTQNMLKGAAQILPGGGSDVEKMWRDMLGQMESRKGNANVFESPPRPKDKP